jgi:diguanylate cyclase (GGDEF)-like protein
MDTKENFLSNPDILQHFNLLQSLGIFSHIESLQQEIRNYKTLLSGATDIFHRTTIDEILETTVLQISDKFLPSFLVFLWRPLQNKKDILLRGYRNFKAVDVQVPINDISPFDDFFQKFPRPINYDLFVYQLNNPAATAPLEELKPEIVVPIIGPSGLYGLILVGPKLLEAQYTTQELAFLDKLMVFATLAIQNNLHYEHSVRDGKTGLFNHGFFMLRLQDEIGRTRRAGHSFSVIVMDVDKFKLFNDNFGHLAGDRVLEQIALAIRDNVRAQDIPSRFGGEEFTVLLPETERSAAWVVAERLRQAVEHTQVPWNPPLPRVTISLGVSVYNSYLKLGANELIEQADEALYISKKRGRNRTTVWGSGLLFKGQRLREKKSS